MNIYSTKQAGQLFGVTPQTIISWLKKSNINCLRTSHKEHILTDDNIQQLKNMLIRRYNLNNPTGTLGTKHNSSPQDEILESDWDDLDDWKIKLNALIDR